MCREMISYISYGPITVRSLIKFVTNRLASQNGVHFCHFLMWVLYNILKTDDTNPPVILISISESANRKMNFSSSPNTTESTAQNILWNSNQKYRLCENMCMKAINVGD